MKKQLIVGAAALMGASMLSTGTVFANASVKSSDVPVSYDNRNTVVDPSDPLAEWSVSIPTAIAFAKDKKTQSVDVELVPINGATAADFTTSLRIEVTAKSENGLKLKVIGDTSGETLSYGITYGSTSLSGTTVATVATLSKTTLKQAGTATLGLDKPKQLALYSDKVTYTISKTQD